MQDGGERLGNRKKNEDKTKILERYEKKTTENENENENENETNG
jgi:hypothetical protein